MAVAFENGDRNLSTGDAVTSLARSPVVVRSMRKLKAEDTLPECKRSLQVRDCDSSVISGNNTKRSRHRSPANVQTPIHKDYGTRQAPSIR
jgi:hypothetical protein